MVAALRVVYTQTVEESPGSMDRLPGNTWERAALLLSECQPATASATEKKPPRIGVCLNRLGKGEMVG